MHRESFAPTRYREVVLTVFCHNFRNFSIGRRNERRLLNMSLHKSPTLAVRFAIVLKVKVLGPTVQLSTSCQVHGAETGAPGLARTV